MEALTKEQILGLDEKQVRLVEIPEMGISVYVRAISGGERDQFESEIVDQRTWKPTRNSMNGFRGKAASYFLSDAEGNRLFDKPNDWQKLSQKPASFLDRVLDAGKELNHMSDTSLEEAEKNSGNGQNADSGTD